MFRTHPGPFQFMIESVFCLTYLMMSSKNLYLSVNSGEILRSVRLRMSPQGPLISVMGQKIICWKLGRGYHFGSIETILVFYSMFLFTAFFV